jgi:7-cyano-7-deazaguanine synthase in queuosine biosynthesis
VIGLSNTHFANTKQEIINRNNSMVILCMYCDNETPMVASVIDFEYYATGAYATAFFICPDCRNKFVVKIQNLGKVR